MRILHVYPINNEGDKPSSFRRSQIKSIEEYVTHNYYFPVLKRKNILNLLYYGLELRKRIKKNEIELVHCHWGTTLSFFGVLFSQVPFVVSFCGSDLLGNYSLNGKKTLRGKISRLFSILSSYLTAHNIVKSSILFNELPVLVRKKTTVLPNGVDSSFFYQRDKLKARQKLNLPLKKKIILFIDRPGAWVKNPKKAREIGKIIEEKEIGVYIEISNISYELMPYYYSAADFLLITSIHEGSCNVLKEALFCNLKVITSPTGDSKERLGQIPECYISNSNNDIVKFIENSTNDQFVTPKSALNSIEIKTIAKTIVNIYNKNNKKK